MGNVEKVKGWVTNEDRKLVEIYGTWCEKYSEVVYFAWENSYEIIQQGNMNLRRYKYHYLHMTL